MVAASAALALLVVFGLAAGSRFSHGARATTSPGVGAGLLESPAGTAALRRALAAALPVMKLAGGADTATPSASPPGVTSGRVSWPDRVFDFLGAVRPGDPRSLLEAQVPIFALAPRAQPSPTEAQGGGSGGGSRGGDPAKAPADAPSVGPPAGEAAAASGRPGAGEESGTDLEVALAALRGKGPVVGIYHTHATEAFIPDLIAAFKMRGGLRGEQAFVENVELTIVQAGLRAARRLEEVHGLEVLHTAEMFDREGRSASYGRSRPVVQRWLQEHPSLALLLDIHRDAGTRRQTTVEHEGRDYARVAVVIGQGQEGYEQPQWRENWAMAKKLISELETMVPGISRGIIFKEFRYNQDLHPGALLLEIGGVENQMEEVLRTADVVADAVVRLFARGELSAGPAKTATPAGAVPTPAQGAQGAGRLEDH